MANFDHAFDKMIRNEGVRAEGTVMKREDWRCVFSAIGDA